MIIGIVYALIAATINLTILGNLLGSGFPIQLAVVGVATGWLYKQSRFAWTVMVTTGILYDALATTRFGLYTLLFIILGAVLEFANDHRTRFGTRTTLFTTTAICGAIVYIGTLVGSGLAFIPAAASTILAALLTGFVTLGTVWILKRYAR